MVCGCLWALKSTWNCQGPMDAEKKTQREATAFVWKEALVLDQKVCSQKKSPLPSLLFSVFLPLAVFLEQWSMVFGSSALAPFSFSQWTDTPDRYLHQVAFMTQAGRVPGSTHMYRVHNTTSKGPRTLEIHKTEARQVSVHTDDITWPCREAELQVKEWTDSHQGSFPLSKADTVRRE